MERRRVDIGDGELEAVIAGQGPVTVVLPPVPIHVLTAGAVKTKSAQRVHDAWKATAARTPTAHYTHVATSGHYMTFDAPDAVVSAILGVLQEAQTHS